MTPAERFQAEMLEAADKLDEARRRMTAQAGWDDYMLDCSEIFDRYESAIVAQVGEMVLP